MHTTVITNATQVCPMKTN